MSPVPEFRRADGFRERGQQVTRTEAFVDAAFAFAVTLLVIADGVPRSVDELFVDLWQIPTVVCSFALIAMFWFGHNTWSRRYGLDDLKSTLLSLGLVFLVLVYIYPLRMLFGTFFGWIGEMVDPDGPLRWPLDDLDGYPDIRAMFVVYGVAWSTMGGAIALHYRRAWALRGALELDAEERAVTYGEIWRWMWVPVTGVLSIVVAACMPDRPAAWLAGAPGFVYFLMFFTAPVTGFAIRRGRRFAKAESAAQAEAGAADRSG